MSRIAILATLVTGLLWSQSGTPSVLKPCREHPKLVGSCFEIKGRLSVYNGAPSLRIWRIGTKRILGISEQNYALPDVRKIPEEVEQEIKPEVELFGDYTVCPLTRSKPGVMQFICVDKVRNMEVRKREEIGF